MWRNYVKAGDCSVDVCILRFDGAVLAYEGVRPSTEVLIVA